MIGDIDKALPRSSPWIEQALFVECPNCGESMLIQSDHAMVLPEEDEEMECEKCQVTFVVEGRKR